MCGICGRVAFDGSVQDRDLIGRMTATIAHRGPDAVGIHVAPGVGLGQTRLSVIDLRQEANPPLATAGGTIWIVFNGEIYNYLEIRASLEQEGVRFSTASDTEVLLRLYEKRGVACLALLRGMFAFAIWDGRAGRLFAARDRLGKKPFYYHYSRNALVFGSEIKAISADPGVSVAPDFRAIDQYLTWQYVPSPGTAFSGVRKLPAAHYLVCDQAGNLEVRRYWNLPPVDNSLDDAKEIEPRIRELITSSIELRLRADVPIGVMLSGGVDSGTVAAIAAQLSPRRISTYSVGFEDDSLNELPFARQTARRYGTDHHEIVLRPRFADVLPKLIWHYNEPFADPSALPTYYVCQHLRQGVTVALSGDGGDENFAGYSRYAEVQRWSLLDAAPRALRKLLASPLRSLSRALPYTNLGARIDRGLNLFAEDSIGRYLQQVSIFKAQERAACYSDFFLDSIGGLPDRSLPLVDVGGQFAPVDWMMRYDLATYLPDCLMTKTDVASMANGLEVRCPLLDQELVEFAATIPWRFKLGKSGGKDIFKRSVSDLLPAQVRTRQKTGFGIPVAEWLRGELQPLMRDAILGAAFVGRGLFRPEFVRRMVDEHVAGKRDWSNRLWALICLELWFREFIR